MPPTRPSAPPTISDSADPARVRVLVASALARPRSPFSNPPARWLLVDVARQQLLLMHGAAAVANYPVSSASNGIGGEVDSFRTPPGWHRVQRAIGAGAATGSVFVSREPTGERWDGAPTDEDLILTRVLTLDGLEDGINRGPGHDSLERYIYLHGTPAEAAIGLPLSHGCVRMRNADIEQLFDAIGVGDPVAIVGDLAAEHYASVAPGAPPSGTASDARDALADDAIDRAGGGRFHYAGLGGSGMSALAQFQVMTGGQASGSDRAFDLGERADARAQLERLGITVFHQDGSGVGADCAAVVASSAVEAQVPDVAAAHARHLPVVHRSEMLAHFVATHRTIAVAGTSGKSTVVAMVFEILRGAARDPGVITGGDLVALQREGLWGNAWAGTSDLLVVEADESDGSLVRYEPAVAVVLNLQKDHKEMSEVATLFDRFVRRARESVVLGAASNVAALGAIAGARGLGQFVFGFDASSSTRGEGMELEADASAFAVDDVRFRLPVPGRHNVENALAAIAACRAVGVPLADMVAPLARFQGVGRRFQSLGSARGVEVVDDFAHNPAKLRATFETARRRAARVLAVYQAHGFGPTRFLRPDLVAAFVESLRPTDRLWLLEIFYAGGTAVRDLSAADLVADIVARAGHAEFAPSREWLVERIASEARAGDLVLVMGARDPSLTGFGRDILRRLDSKEDV